MMGENQQEILEACKGVKQLFMPAGDDPEDVYPGGIAEKVHLQSEKSEKVLIFVYKNQGFGLQRLLCGVQGNESRLDHQGGHHGCKGERLV